MRRDPGETNKLILKIMTLYSKINKEELIATLCTMDEEHQEMITEMIEEFGTRLNSPVKDQNAVSEYQPKVTPVSNLNHNSGSPQSEN